MSATNRQRGAVKVAPHFSLTPEVNAMVDALAADEAEREGLGAKPDRSKAVSLAVRAAMVLMQARRGEQPSGGGPGVVAARKGRAR